MDENVARGGKANSTSLQMVMAMKNKSRFATGPRKSQKSDTWFH